MSDNSTMMDHGATAALQEALQELSLDGDVKASKRLRTGKTKDEPPTFSISVPALAKTEPSDRPKTLTVESIKTLIPPGGVPTAVLARQLSLFKNDATYVAGLVKPIAVMENNVLYPKNSPPTATQNFSRPMHRVVSPRTVQAVANLRKENITARALHQHVRCDARFPRWPNDQ